MKNIGISIVCCFLFTTTAFSQLKISNGTFFTSKDVWVILSNIDIVNDGTISSNNSKFVFTGAGNNTISGTGATIFNNIEVAKQNNAKLSLLMNITASGSVVFNGGFIDLGNRQLELLYPNGLLQNEKENSRITTNGSGEVFIVQTLNAPNNANPGNLGASITSTQNLGITTIRRGHQIQTNNAQQSIQRYFQIEPANNTNLNADLRFQYFDAELNNLTETTLLLFKKEGTSDWTLVGKDAGDATSNFIQKNGINSLQKFSLFSSAAGALPLTLLAFDVTCKGSDVLLQWITTNEVNTKQFVVEKSDNGTDWKAVSTVGAAGNGVQQNIYSVSITAGADYYRLKMEDADGKFSYSPVKKINCGNADKIWAGPNPTKSNLTVTATMNKPASLLITVVDVSGRTIVSKLWPVKAGLNSQVIDLSGRAAGTYLMLVKGNDIRETIKIIRD